MSSSCARAKEFFEAEARIGQVLAVHVGQDLDAAHAELVDAAVEFGDRHVRVLQRDRAHRDETLGPGGDDFGEAVVDLARELAAEIGFRPVEALVRRRRDRLDVDAHAVHVLQPHFDRRQLGPAVLHLLDVDFARQRVGELAGRLVLSGIEMRDFRRHRRVLIVTMDIDAQAAALPVANGFRGRRGARTADGFQAALAQQHCGAMMVGGIAAAGCNTGEHHDVASFILKIKTSHRGHRGHREKDNRTMQTGSSIMDFSVFSVRSVANVFLECNDR